MLDFASRMRPKARLQVNRFHRFSMTATSVRLAKVRQDISAAAKDAGRAVDDVTLIAVSKTFHAAAIRPVIEAGQRVFGENRVQESQGKWPDLKTETPDIELHLIGPLQSNKARDAVRLFDVIETVDRPKVARALADAMDREGFSPEIYVQVNTGEEEQKAGISPKDAVSFVEECRGLGLNVTGLMCIPPIDEEPAMHFSLLDKLAGEASLDIRSMGMSADYQTAIRFGATHVRVGSAIFGERKPYKLS